MHFYLFLHNCESKVLENKFIVGLYQFQIQVIKSFIKSDYFMSDISSRNRDTDGTENESSFNHSQINQYLIE